MGKIGIAVHGGAGTILKSKMTAEREAKYRTALEEALMAGWKCLLSGMSSLQAVEIAVEEMENNILFNAGKGSVFTNEGKHEMDASIMDGKTLKAGCVSSVSSIKNPVKLAAAIMKNSEFVYLGGRGAQDFARENGIEFENDEYFYSAFRYDQYQNALQRKILQLDHSDEDSDKKFGTVGAVALDRSGNLAAATSTGGITNKKYGRVGDSPVIGAGNYANNKTCAVSCTGNGEHFLRSVTAFNLSALMEYRLQSLEEAARIVIHEKLKSIGGEGGLIAIDKDCNVSMEFNSEGMYRALKTEGVDFEIKIWK